MNNIKVKTPGKLYVAGEYAVVEPGYSAIITSVDRFVDLTVREVPGDCGRIFSKGFTAKPVFWKRVHNQVQLKQTMPTLDYILAAIHTAEAYMWDLGRTLKVFDLELLSELDSDSGQKFGLGSSGAVTVATVQALLAFYQVEPSDLVVYKLSVLAQLKLAVNSSFGDLAASAYTGWIRYTSFDRKVVAAALREKSVKEVVEMDWPFLAIERLQVAPDVRFLIGWTGAPASSDYLVGDVQKRKTQNKSDYQNFLEKSQHSVQAMAQALQSYAVDNLKQAIKKNRSILLQMGQQTNVLIETPQLSELCEIANHFGGAAKTSGAGGGDSGIAFVFDEESAQKIKRSWQAHGITPLPLAIYQKE